MSLTYHSDCSTIQWKDLATVISRAPLGEREVDVLEQAFRGSFVSCFVEDDGELIGAGRAISDGATNSAIFDVVVLPEHQHRGIGTGIVEYLLHRLPQRSVLLVSVPRQQKFYEKLGFRKLKSAYLRHEDIERWIRDGYVDADEPTI